MAGRLAWSLIASLGVISLARGDAPTWVKLTDKAGFTPRDSCGELVYKDQLWILGGWLDSFQEPPRDVWSSADGMHWMRATKQAPWKHSDFPMAAVFKDRMWIMGGWHGGRLAGASASNSVWSSANGAEWKLETPAAEWSPRMSGGLVVFKQRLWLLGGVQKYYFGGDEDLKNDVWSSADGVHWQRVVASAAWARRAYIAPVVLGDRMYVFGGGNYLPNYQAYNDVWSSADGVRWTRETEHAGWSPRIWFSAVTYRDRMWILGGWSNNPSKNWPDAWHSADGKTWRELKTANGWKERHEHSTYVFQDSIFVVGGHAQPLNSEVWRLHLPKDWNGE